MCFPVESVVKHGEKTLRPKNVILKRLTQVSKLCSNLMAVNIGIYTSFIFYDCCAGVIFDHLLSTYLDNHLGSPSGTIKRLPYFLFIRTCFCFLHVSV